FSTLTSRATLCYSTRLPPTSCSSPVRSFSLMPRRPPTSPLFPYTTLFRSAHGHQFADITRRAPQGCSAARQREDLRENRSDGHADPDQVECQLHNLSDYSMHAGAAKQQKGDCGAGESTRRASPYFLEQPATEALEASALVLSRACLLRGQ